MVVRGCHRGVILAVVLVLVFAGLTPGESASAAEFSREQLEHFEKHVRPLLVARCYQCHSHDSKRLEGGLYLDSRAGLLRGGDSGSAIDLKQPDDSLLISAIRYESFEMPPKGRLPKQEQDTLVKWIRDGAPWPDEPEPMSGNHPKPFDWQARKAAHWCWQPLRNVTPPAVPADSPHADWPLNPIDNFILQRQTAADLTPSSPADRRTLIRRVTFDLIGLPPKPAEVETFLQDDQPGAYERVVDRLLESPRFGEKWTRHWLDLVRYAETCGHEFDYPLPHASRYRDYLIRAFNADVPYDQLVREHIAGDLLPEPRRHPQAGYNESVIGTGFWFFGEATHSPTDVRLDEALRIDNQIDVFSKTFLGLTVSCARCHDHKFDPIPTADYYALAGYLQSTRRNVAWLDPDGRRNAATAKMQQAQEDSLQLLRDASQGFPAKKTDNNNWLHPAAETETVTRYLLAARAAWQAPKVDEAPVGPQDNSDKDILFEDFEGDNYDGWIITGKPFGDRPANGTIGGQQPVSGFLGKGLVNTYLGSDRPQGTATSKAFKIERPFIQFLIGGGHHAGKTCMNLLIDGKPVRTAVGKGPTDRERLSLHAWDVREFVGKTAQLEIVDRESGGWGHINVDHIVFTDKARASVSKQTPAQPTARTIASIAAAYKLDANRLTAWVRALAELKQHKSPSHDPLVHWSRLLATPDADLPRALANPRQQATVDRQPLPHEHSLFNLNDGANSWFPDGRAFAGNTTPELNVDLSADQLAFTMPGTLGSGRLSKQLRGALRSPTFELTHSKIFILMKARSVDVRLIIDGYQMEPYNGLLFGGTRVRNVDTKGEWQWISLGNDMYRGHKAYLEFPDVGDGEFAVQQVVLSDGSQPKLLSHANGQWLQDLPEKLTLQQLAEQIAQAWSARLQDWHIDLVRAPRSGPYDVDAIRETTGSVNALLAGGVLSEPSQKLAEFRKQRATLEQNLPAPIGVTTAVDGTGENERVFIRGSHTNLGPVAPRNMLRALLDENNNPLTPADGSGRLLLAEQVLARNNPLAARVAVNRLWHHLFGRGIVPTVDDFGVMGQAPSHPDLLDWLANDFREQGWSIKRAIKQMVLSRTYQQSSRPTNAQYETADPTNKLLHRMRIRRLTAEQLRDSLLAVSGRLNTNEFASSVPINLTSFMQGRGRPGRNGPLDGDGRRSLYLEVRRNFLVPMLTTFDFPSPFSTMGRRTVSNVPAQALMLMNDPFVVQQAGVWAESLCAKNEAAGVRMTRVFEQAFSRPPTPAEIQQARRFLETQAKSLNTTPGDPRVWQDFCHVLFNKKEFSFLR